jgi:hypothetical protein
MADRSFELTPPDAPGSWIGTDEAGKGDYFGPLVVAGIYQLRENLDIHDRGREVRTFFSRWLATPPEVQ